MTIAEISTFVKAKLSEHFNENEIKAITMRLVEHFWAVSANDFYIYKSKQLDEKAYPEFLLAVDALQNNKPLQYVLGRTEFYGCTIFVNENVLIPRPETEELVDWIITENTDISTILDIGTGSACIAIALAKNIESAKVTALDFSEKALNTAIANAEFNEVDIEFCLLDILNENISLPTKFDVIVSNPPYIRDCEKREMKANVLDFEPHTALFVPDGNALIFYKAIANFALHNLAEGGKIYLEINENLGDETAEIFKHAGFAQTELRQDLSGKNRMLRVKK